MNRRLETVTNYIRFVGKYESLFVPIFALICPGDSFPDYFHGVLDCPNTFRTGGNHESESLPPQAGHVCEDG